MGVGTIAKTGLQAALSNMETISNNIANVNTIGYKKGYINFSDIYMSSANGASNKSTGLGTRVSSVNQNFSLGRVESSSSGLDLTIGGDGFFVEKNSATGLVSYTRAGRLAFDNSGNLTGFNGIIQGYPAVNGQIVSSGTLVDLNVPSSAIPAQATTTINMGINLNSSDLPITSTFNPNDPTTYNFRSDESIYDSLGNQYLMSLYYVKTANNTWTSQVAVNNSVIGTGALTFNSSGALTSSTGMSGLTWNPGGGAAAGQLTVNLANSTQFSGNNTCFTNSQDGCPSGTPLGCAIDDNGNLNVSYSNGLTRTQGQIAVAQFRSPEGLSQSDNMSWIPTSASGPVILNPQAGYGNILTNTIEYSNVDLTNELVDLISAQHDFQANAQVQQTYNQILQTIENL